jgi:hypothetical protein
VTVAKKDVYIERPDLGPDVFTFVAAGEEIPAALEAFKRHDNPATRKS